MTTDQTDRAEHLRVRAHNIERELKDLNAEISSGTTDEIFLKKAIEGVVLCRELLLKLVDRGKLPRHRPATLNPFDSLHAAICTTSKDMGKDKLDAWLYAVVVGWDDALPEVAAEFGWSEETQSRLRQLHEVFNSQKELHKS